MTSALLQSIPLPRDLSAVDGLLASLTIYGLKVIAAAVILLIGLWLAKRLRNLFLSGLEARD